MATLKVYESADRVKGAGSARMPITPVLVELSKKDESRRTCYTTQKEFLDSLVANGGFGIFDVKVVDCDDACTAVVANVVKDKLGKCVRKVFLAEVTDNDRIKINVPVVLVVPEQVHKGEMLVVRNHRYVRVRGKVADIPRQFRVDLTGRDAPAKITAADVEMPRHIELITDEDEVLYVLSSPTRTS